MEIKWLKGYCIPSTFTENIPDQSWDSNRGTPCMKKIPAMLGKNENERWEVTLPQKDVGAHNGLHG